MSKKTAHIISHTHWDREWYINSKFVNEWLPPFFDGLFKMLDKEPEYRFVLDGQTSVLDDCYVELEKLGRSVDEFKDRVKKYAKEGRLVLGPYYLQPDWQLVSDESLVRNMMIGRQMSKELGGGTSTGWLLDNFGQVSQAPQIHKLFDMKGIVVWRGVELDPINLNSEFEWVGPDGTKMTCSYLLSSYRNAMHLADYPDIINERIKNESEKIEPFATTDNVLLMNGYDQEMQPDDIIPFIKSGKADFGHFEIRQSTPDEYMGAVLEQRGELQQLHNALYSGRYISVFPGILSSRMYLKTMNDEAQRQLEQYAEPLNAMTAMLGEEYPQEEMLKSWKLLLKNHPHDSICGVSVDDVHSDMEDRFKETMAISKELTDKAMSKLSAIADTSVHNEAKGVYTVVNTMPKERMCDVFLPCDIENAVVKDADMNICKSQKCENGIIAQVKMPAFAPAIVGVYEQTAETEKCDDTLYGENDYYRIVFNDNGSFTYTDKKNNKTYENVGMLENMADVGDEYNYSFMTGDKAITSENVKAEIEFIENGCVRKVFKVTRLWEISSGLSDDRSERSEEKSVLPVITFITVSQNSPVVGFKTIVRNTCKNHRVRVLFPTEIVSDVSYAQTQFDITTHPITPVVFDNSGIPEEVKRIIIGARESIPITQFPQRDFCAVSDEKITASVINRGLPEYEVLEDKNTIALTLFRSQQWLARFDLNTRIGDAGPEMFTPDALCLRDMEFDYGFVSLEGKPETSGLTEIATMHNNPVIVSKTDCHKGIDISSFMNIDCDTSVKVTALKFCENKDGIIVRLHNVSNEIKTAKITVNATVNEGMIVTPYEETISNLEINNNSVEVNIASKEIVTVKIKAETLKTACGEVKEAESFWDEKFNVDLSEWKIPEIVSEEEIASEELRADKSEQTYNEARELQKLYEKEIEGKQTTPAEKTKAATLRMKAEAILRASLEARLSAIFAREKANEIKMGRYSAEFKAYQETLVEPLRDLALKLNYARIDKRVSEYITDYYTHKEKLLGDGK